MKKQILKLSVLSLVGAMFVVNANAAPTVRKLGTSTSNTATSGTTTARAASVTPARASSVRLNTASANKPASVSTVKAPASASKATTTSNADEARLSLGKYLHGATIVRPDTPDEPGVSSDALLRLQERVTNAEADIDTLQVDVETATQDINNHINNTDIHVTAAEKENWDDKQDALTAGKGIIIEKQDNKTVISSIMKVPYGSAEGERIIPIWVE